MRYQKNLLIHNIYELAKQRQISIGSLEKDIGVSAGYFSRLKSDTKQTVPGIDILIAVADRVGVTLDNLCFIDSSKSSIAKNELTVIEFIEHINELTQKNKLSWNLLSLENIRKKINNKALDSELKLFFKLDSRTPGISHIFYNSLFINDMVSYDLEEGLLSFEFNNNTYYLNMISINKNNSKCIHYEFYLLSGNKLHKIASTYKNPINEIVISLNNLYVEAINNASHLKLDEDVINEIDEFMKVFSKTTYEEK